jgi:hypothetical protein
VGDSLSGHRYAELVVGKNGPGFSTMDRARQLKERLIENNLGDRVLVTETVDKMTDPQIAAKVREHFAG